MKITMKPWLVALGAAALLVGCQGAADDEEIELTEAEVAALAGGDKADLAGARALPEGAEHLYFDAPLDMQISEDGHLAYAWFVAKGRHQLKVTVAELGEDGKPSRAGRPAFKLQRLVRSGGRYRWSVVAQSRLDREHVAWARHTPRTTSLFLVTATSASPLPRSLRIGLGCAGGDHAACAPERQPGDACGGLAAFRCDEGLYCRFDPGSCGRGDQAGTCNIPPRFCQEIYLPICGCDAQTYGNACEAAASGVSIDQLGACGCAPGEWRDVTDPQDGQIGGLYHDETGQYTYEISDAEPYFAVTFEPGCRRATPPCALPSWRKVGTWQADRGLVTLIYDDGSPSETYQLQESCEHKIRLYSAERTLSE